jgi:hypothetical protein
MSAKHRRLTTDIIPSRRLSALFGATCSAPVTSHPAINATSPWGADECLDHVIVFSEAGLYRHLRNFADYYHRSRTHLGLQKDTPERRPI